MVRKLFLLALLSVCALVVVVGVGGAAPGQGRIVFASRLQYPVLSHVVSVALDGLRRRDLSGSAEMVSDSNAVMSPDRTKIGFIRYGAVWLMNADGSDQHEILASASSEDFTGLAWSPDSRLLAVDDVSSLENVQVINLDGQHVGGVWPARDAAWSPDGKHLAYAYDLGDRPIVVSSADGSGRRAMSPLVHLPSGQCWRFPAWSPDDRWLAFEKAVCSSLRSLALYLVPLGHGKRRVISGASDPVWSPSGSHLTYLHGSQGRSRLLLAHEDGSGAVAVTADVVGTPIWSPDNLRLAFASETTGQIATLSVAKPFRHRSISHEPRGSVLTPLAYSHDGRRIFYTATAVSHGASPISATNLNVWTINPDGSGLTQLTSSTASDDRAPAWSPDGSRIAFSRQSGPDPTTDRASIFSVAASGGNPIQLTADAAKFDTDPAWSPNGTKIAFVRQAGNTSSDLFLINADGSGLRRLTSGNDVGAPVWSPDGSKIAFSGLNGNSPGLFIVGADGSVLRQPEGGWPSTPSWSPDGKKLAYVVSWGADPSVDLVVESADGSDHGPQVYQRCGDKFGQAGKYIAWSPDGSRIAFVCGASFGGDSPATWLFVASTDGSDLRKIVTVPVNKNDFDPIRSPSWSPDSKSLVYEATVDLPNAGTRQSIFTVAADGSKPIELTPFPTDSLDPTRSR